MFMPLGRKHQYLTNAGSPDIASTYEDTKVKIHYPLTLFNTKHSRILKHQKDITASKKEKKRLSKQILLLQNQPKN